MKDKIENRQDNFSNSKIIAVLMMVAQLTSMPYNFEKMVGRVNDLIQTEQVPRGHGKSQYTTVSDEFSGWRAMMVQLLIRSRW